MDDPKDKPRDPWSHLLKNGAKAGNPTLAPRCGAHARTSGKPCLAPAMRGKRRCRLHGGKSTGPKSDEGRRRIGEAHFKHGEYSNENMQALSIMRKLLKIV